MNGQPPVLSHLSTLADGLRVRMLLVLEGQEFPVSEIGEILQLPQSTVSRHLKTLADDGWVTSRREGTSRLYTLAREELSRRPPKALWTRRPAGDGVAHGRRPRRRAAAASTSSNRAAPSRRRSSRPPPVSGIGCATSLFGQTFHLQRPARPDRRPLGRSPISAAAPGARARRSRRSCRAVIAVDASEEMLAAARVAARRRTPTSICVRARSKRCRCRRRLARRGAHQAGAASLADPGKVLAEAARVL